MAVTPSAMVLLACSATPFCCGLFRTVCCLEIPASVVKLWFQKNHFLYSGEEYVGACNAQKPVFPICHFWALWTLPLLTQVQSQPMPFIFSCSCPVFFFGFSFVILCCIRVCYLF